MLGVVLWSCCGVVLVLVLVLVWCGVVCAWCVWVWWVRGGGGEEGRWEGGWVA